MDGWNHSTRLVDPDRDPDACVIFSVAKSLEPGNKHPVYAQLVADMKEPQLPDGWQFYDHLKDAWVKATRYGPHKGPNP